MVADADGIGARDHVLDRRDRRVVRRKAISLGRVDPKYSAAVYVLLRRHAATEAGEVRITDWRTRTRLTITAISSR